MKPILLRAPKGPFEVVSAEETFERNLIGDNSGNLVFIEAAHKVLSTPGREIVPDRFRYAKRDAPRINERYESYVIPLANAFRPRFEANLGRMTDVIERLRIPVVVLGVGAQGTLAGDWTRLTGMEPTIRRFVAAVLDRSPSIGVRGAMTAEYLARLGFRDIDVIGCPSMFMWGGDLRVDKRETCLARDARVSITVSPYVKQMGPIVVRHLER
jgi:Polysaccharide pyruvyl transferase